MSECSYGIEVNTCVGGNRVDSQDNILVEYGYKVYDYINKWILIRNSGIYIIKQFLKH